MEIDDRKIMCNERHETVVREQIQKEEGQEGEGSGAEKRVLDKHICPWSFPLTDDAQHHTLEVSAWTLLWPTEFQLSHRVHQGLWPAQETQ